MSEDPSAPTQPETPLTSPITYTEGALGKSKKGTLAYDGEGRVTLTGADGSTVMDAAIADLGKVRRAEYGLYFKPNGKLVFAAFGNALAYGATAVAGTTSTPAFAATTAAHHSMNRESGIEDWVQMLKRQGALGLNAGPLSGHTWAIAGIGAAVVILIGVIVALVS